MENGKWAYLAAWMDRYSRKIVGWNLDVHMREELVLKALQNAIDRYKPSHGLIVHSDRGGQYFGNRFRKLLDKCLFRQSMVGKKSVYENAHADRADFYGLCKHTSIIFVIFLPVMHHRADTMDEFVANGIQNGHFVLAFSDLSQIIVLNFAARAAPL